MAQKGKTFFVHMATKLNHVILKEVEKVKNTYLNYARIQIYTSPHTY